MRLAVVCISLSGMVTGRRVVNGIEESLLFVPEHILAKSSKSEKIIGFKLPLSSLMGTLMEECREILFIMAAGIVVRQIAPFIINKRVDPAVVVMDEKGVHVISLLSGHLGGANALTARLASITEGRAVITTASDVQGKPAIDMVAEESCCLIENPERVAPFMRAFLDGQCVNIIDPSGVISEKFREYENINFLKSAREAENSENIETVLVSVDSNENGVVDNRLLLRPKKIVAGVGCRRGATLTEIEEAFKWACGIARVSPLSLSSIATVDIKGDEQGLLDMAKKYRVPLRLFSVDQINAESGEGSGEGRVKSLIGANGVCEPCTALAGGRGKLILKKVKYKKRVTIALAVEE